MVRTGSLTLTALSSLVLMRISDLVPLCKFTKLLWEHLVFTSWHSFCRPSCDQWCLLQRWQVTTSQHFSLQEPFKQNLLWNGQKNISLFSVKKDLPTVTTVLSISAYPLPFFMKQSTADKEGWQSPLQRHTNHKQLVPHRPLTPEPAGAAAQSSGVCWRSHNKFVAK